MKSQALNKVLVSVGLHGGHWRSHRLLVLQSIMRPKDRKPPISQTCQQNCATASISLTQERPIEVASFNPSRTTFQGSKNFQEMVAQSPLTRINKSFSAETLPVFYVSNTFQLLPPNSLAPRFLRANAQCTAIWLHAVGSKNRKLLKRAVGMKCVCDYAGEDLRVGDCVLREDGFKGYVGSFDGSHSAPECSDVTVVPIRLVENDDDGA